MIFEFLAINLIILNEIAIFYVITDFIENRTKKKVKQQQLLQQQHKEKFKQIDF